MTDIQDTNLLTFTFAVVVVWQLAIQSIPAFLAVIMATFGICSSNPPTPPSSSAETPSEPFIIGVKKLAKNKMYWLLALAIGGGIGLFSVLTTLLSQILCPWGYTDVSALLNNYGKLKSLNYFFTVVKIGIFIVYIHFFFRNTLVQYVLQR